MAGAGVFLAYKGFKKKMLGEQGAKTVSQLGSEMMNKPMSEMMNMGFGMSFNMVKKIALILFGIAFTLIGLLIAL